MTVLVVRMLTTITISIAQPSYVAVFADMSGEPSRSQVSVCDMHSL